MKTLPECKSGALRALRWLLLLPALALVLCSCWGKRELEERSFIEVIGIDEGTRERLLVTIAISPPRVLEPGRKGAKELSSLILSSEGRDVLDALAKIGAFNSRELSGVHASSLIFGEEFAKRDVAPALDAFSRGLQLRPNTNVLVCQGMAYDFIRKVQSPEEETVANYLKTLVSLSARTQSTCPVATVHDFTNKYQVLSSSPWAPYLGVAATSVSGREISQTDTGMKEERESEEPRPGVVLGTAVFALENGGYRMVGWLGLEESKTALLLAGKAQNWFMTFGYPGDLAPSTIMVQHVSVRNRVKRMGDNIEVHFRIRLTCSLDEFSVNAEAPVTTHELRAAAAATISERIAISARDVFRRLGTMKADVISLGKSVQGTFITYPQWEAFDWPSKLAGVEPSFDVNVQVFSTGFTFRRALPR